MIDINNIGFGQLIYGTTDRVYGKIIGVKKKDGVITLIVDVYKLSEYNSSINTTEKMWKSSECRPLTDQEMRSSSESKIALTVENPIIDQEIEDRNV